MKQESFSSTHKKTSSNWLLLDADGQVLGRLATKIATKLLGKENLDTSRNSVANIKIVVINTDKVAVTGKKEDQKFYYRYSGYPGGIKKRTLSEQRNHDSRKIIAAAVSGMLPKNSLRDKRMSNLLLFPDDKHPHTAHFTN